MECNRQHTRTQQSTTSSPQSTKHSITDTVRPLCSRQHHSPLKRGVPTQLYVVGTGDSVLSLLSFLSGPCPVFWTAACSQPQLRGVRSEACYTNFSKQHINNTVKSYYYMFHAYMHALETQCGKFMSWKSTLTFFILFLQVVIICGDGSQLFQCTRHLRPTYIRAVNNNSNSGYSLH